VYVLILLKFTFKKSVNLGIFRKSTDLTFFPKFTAKIFKNHSQCCSLGLFVCLCQNANVKAKSDSIGFGGLQAWTNLG
jgi:hypothetical protein